MSNFTTTVSVGGSNEPTSLNSAVTKSSISVIDQYEEGRGSSFTSNAFTMKQVLRTAKQKHISSQPENINDAKLIKEKENDLKQAKRKELELIKNKALLEQRVEMLKLENVELLEKSEEQKSMYEKMLNALQSNTDNSSYEKMMSFIKEFQSKQPEDLSSIRKLYDCQITDLRRKFNQSEINEQSLKTQLEQQK